MASEGLSMRIFSAFWVHPTEVSKTTTVATFAKMTGRFVIGIRVTIATEKSERDGPEQQSERDRHHMERDDRDQIESPNKVEVQLF
jgi:hypothetical protein